MKKFLILIFFCIFSFVALHFVYSQEETPTKLKESDTIAVDRQALKQALTSRISSRIIAAKIKLSDDLDKEEQMRRKDAEGFEIPLTMDSQGHYLVDVVINGSIHASLVVDTGAPIVLLSSKFISILGIDPQKANKSEVVILNGKYTAAQISLPSIQLTKAQGKEIPAAVLIKENNESSDALHDGLLGLSFLNRFRFSLDQKHQKLILKNTN